MMRFDFISIFPGFFSGPLEFGVVSRAIRSGLVQVAAHDLRTFTQDRHRTVDDRPFGGGEGMVLKPEPIFACVESLHLLPKAERGRSSETLILLSAQGRRFTQNDAVELSRMDRVVFLCGRYEGVDERVNELLCDRELSIGDYVLSGGELAGLVILDAVVRLLPGVLGNPDSARFESFGANDAGSDYDPGDVPPSTHGSGGLLDYPHYTRPSKFQGASVPEVLQQGNHVEIRRWRRERALEKTFRNRPELLQSATLGPEDEQFLASLEGSSGSEPRRSAPVREGVIDTKGAL